jgi:hypothetical protein
VIAAIGAIDQRLNPSIDVSLRSRLRQLRQNSNGEFVLTEIDVAGPFAGRTLLFVHGTFSNAKNMLAEFKSTAFGQQFLNRAMSGSKKYDRVVFFEHATLSVSPVINALELGRAFAGSTGQIHTIAHSRGGLIVRWWLEAFGSSLRLTGSRSVRVVFAGSPLHGTSLAAPDKLQSALSLISNIGTFADITLKIAGATNPFIWVGSKLVEVIVSVTGALAKTPLVDALVALIPGLAGQSAVEQPRTQSSTAWTLCCESALLCDHVEFRDGRCRMEVLEKFPFSAPGMPRRTSSSRVPTIWSSTRLL